MKKRFDPNLIPKFDGLRPKNFFEKLSFMAESCLLVVSAKKRVNKCQLEQYR